MIRTPPMSIFRLMLLFAMFVGIAHAEPIKIVAFGGSNTFGKGVSRDEAYPAQLERLLRAAGYDVVVKNEGTSGQTTGDELGRLDSAVPDGVKIVIFQPGGNDDRGYLNKSVSGNTGDNIRTVVQKLLDRHILVLFSGRRDQRRYVEDLNVTMIGPIKRLAPETEQQGDQEHLTPKGYEMVAERMLPRVEELLNKLSKRP